ncbi:MAG: ATP-binding protein [Acidobacteria bacterium]|nr:ATP-binding protein [Acidobacteriota bacterium]
MTYPEGANSHPREQTARIMRLIAQEGQPLRVVLLGKRREGKTDLLRQLQSRLFESAEGPIPFLYSFAGSANDDALARSFLASLCQQVRGFLMRQEEMLLEPAAALESELQRAGLPMSLSEMARSFLSLTPSQQCEHAGIVVAQFAHREGRPVCLLLDDCEALPHNAAILRGLNSPFLSWLLTGRLPFASRLAGARAWPVLRLDPFSREDALAIAKQNCRASGITFVEEVWDQWCGVAGTSASLIEALVLAAAVREDPLDSIEQLGRVYFRDLSSGSIGNWLARRLEQAVPERLDRAPAIEVLIAAANSVESSRTDVLNPQIADGLVAEEWAEETASGPRVALEPVQRDWLLTVAAAPNVPPERSQIRRLQQLLLSVRQRGKQASDEPFLNQLRSRLMALPETGLPKIVDLEWPMLSPRISDVYKERSGGAELYWFYGTVCGESLFVLLIVLCPREPSNLEVADWRRELDQEIRLLHHGPAPPDAQAAHKLWLLVPPAAPLMPTHSERRFTWQTLSNFLDPAHTAVRTGGN